MAQSFLRTAPRRAAGLTLALAWLAACGDGAPHPRLLLLITVDTLRADRLGAYGSERGLTPHLDALAARSEVFDAAYAPASFTLPSVAALLTGRYPESVGVTENDSVLQGVPTLAGELAARGWWTAAVVSNFVLRDASGVSAGFQHFDDRLPQREASRRMPERDARLTTDALRKVIDACTQADDAHCFVWGHYQDPHGPYTPPPGRREQLLPRARAAPDGRRRLPLLDELVGLGGIPSYQALGGEREVAFYRAGYDAEIAYADEQIGRLLDHLEARGLAAQSAVVFAADHGEGLGEDDYWFSHGLLLRDYLVRVPLLLHVPGRAPGRRDDVVSLVDVFPTLLRLASGGDAPADGPGRDLLAAGARRAASAPYLATLGGSPAPTYGIVDGDWKLVVTELADGPRVQLFRRGRDSVDVADGTPERVAELRRRLEEQRRRHGSGAAPRRQELDAEDRARLRALGYADDGGVESDP